MKELGKIIAKNRKENKMKQGELAKKLESYDIFVKKMLIERLVDALHSQVPDSYWPSVSYLIFMMFIRNL